MMANQLRAKYDIIINGGGIVGFTLLNLLLKSPHLSRAKILLIEQGGKPSTLGRPSQVKTDLINLENKSSNVRKFSNRVSSITLASKRAFEYLGIWDSVKPHAKIVRRIHVWNYDFDDRIDFRQEFDDGHGEERCVMFSTLENNRISSALLDNIMFKLNKPETITWSSRLIHMEESLDSGLIDVSLINEEAETVKISAPLILGCDGYKSKVRELTKMCYREYDLKKTALIGTVKMTHQPTNSENSIAYQRFSTARDTVAALLPLDNDFSSFVISAPTEYANYLKECEDETFTQEFNEILIKKEEAPNIILRRFHELSNTTYDNLNALLQLIRSRLKSSDPTIVEDRLDEEPRVDYVVKDSRAIFPLVFGSTSPKMVTSLPGINKIQVALLGDSSHRVHPLAGQGLNMGIQDAIELVRQMESIARTGANIFLDYDLLGKALKRYEFNRQAYVMLMSAGILSMPGLFKLAPSKAVSSANRCLPMKKISIRMANGC